MGSVSQPLPQGPNQHCGGTEPHSAHPNPSTLYAKAWCDGVPQLEPFVELVVRVPFVGYLTPMPGTPHEKVVQLIAEEGIGTYTTDEMGVGGYAKASLRVRWGGKDVVYPLKDGRLEPGE